MTADRDTSRDAEPEAAAQAAQRTGAETARAAGRGGIAIAFAKIYFMVTGLAQQIALGNILVGGGYGALSTVMGIASITYNPLIQTGIQGVSRPVAQATDEERPGIVRSVLRVHFALGTLVAVAFFVLAPWIARATGAPYLTLAFRLFSAVLFAYALYGPLVGILNGLQRFTHQAGLDILAATLRTGLMVGGAWWFARRHDAGEEGAAVGFAASAVLMFLIAAALTGFGKTGTSGPSAQAQLRFIGPLLLGQFILNLLFQADLQLLGAFARDAALAAGNTAAEADQLVGAYRASQLFGFLPYQLLIAVSFVLFPLLARAHTVGDRASVAKYVRTGVRIALILAGLAVGISSGLSEGLLRLVFPAQPFARIGGDAMQILTIGLGAFAIFGILITVLNSLGHERTATLLTAVAFALVATTCFAFVRSEPFGELLLVKTALATTTAHILATAGAAALVRRVAGGVVEPLSVLRVLGCTAVTVAVARHLPQGSKVLTLAEAAGVALLYLILLAATRELRGADLAQLAAVGGRRRRA